MIEIKRIYSEEEKSKQSKLLYDGVYSRLNDKVFVHTINDVLIKVKFSDFENNNLSYFSMFLDSMQLFSSLKVEPNILYHEVTKKLRLKIEKGDKNEEDKYYPREEEFSAYLTVKNIENVMYLICYGFAELNNGRATILLQGILTITEK